MDMSAIEDELQQLALKLDDPFSPKGEPDEVCMLLGRRARELHRGYVRCARGGYVVASRALKRPALEVNILLRFIRQHPEHRARLWVVEETRLGIQIFETTRKHRLVEQGMTNLQLPTDEELIEWRRAVGRVRKAANDAGIPGVSSNANGRLIPPLAEQVELLESLRRSNPDDAEDALIAATARYESATLITEDQKLRRRAKAVGIVVVSWDAFRDQAPRTRHGLGLRRLHL